jgi:parvulin-like peptidyl-prolyl isomerase
LTLPEFTADQLALLRRHNLLLPLLRQQLIADAVADAPIDEDTHTNLMASFRKREQLEDPDDWAAYLRDRGASEADLAWQLELPFRMASHCSEHFQHKAEAHFLERKNQLDQVVYSLLRVKDRFLAQELYLRIAGQEANFADLAAQYAEGPEQRTNGIVGPVPLTQAHPALAERLRTSAPGTLMEPFSIAEWWLVVRLESYTPASFDESTAERMARELFEEWVNEETTLKLRQLSPVQVPALQQS